MVVNSLEFIVNRKILIGLISVLVIALGSFSIFQLDKELLPSVGLDGAYVEIHAGEMAAAEVERTITTPLEQKLLSIDGVENIESTTNIGRTSLRLTLERGRGDEVYKEVESIINAAKAENSSIKDVMSMQSGKNQNYEFFLDVSGNDMKTITTFAKNVLEPRLEDLKEVRDVALSGVLEQEVSIAFKREELVKRGLDVTQIIGAIQQANSEATLGELSNAQNTQTLRWNTTLGNLTTVKKISIPTSTGFIELQEVADVSLQPLDHSSFVWKNGTKDFIFVQVGRVSDATQIEMADAVRAEIQKIRDEDLIKDFELNEMVAQADYVKQSIDGVTGNILIGGAIAVAILLLFLRNIRATFIIGLSIPTSVLLTFATMWVFDYSFNILTLIGLGLGIGMMVDSSIVILEAIYKKKEQGLANLEAVLTGTKEVAGAVISSMLTTIVVFLPIGLIGGEMGSFMMMLSAVVSITLISSVVISFTLIPSLAEKILKVRKQKELKKNGPIMKVYSKTIAWTIKKKRNSLAVIFLFLIMLAGSIVLVPKIPMTIMPDMYNRYTEITVQLDPGLSLEEKNELTKKMDEKLSTIKDLESNYVMDNGGMFYTIINMTKGEDITREQKEVNEDILKSLRELEETQPIKGVQSALSAGGGYPVQVNIKGDSFEDLQAIAGDFIKDLESVDGIVGVTNSIERTSEEQLVVLKEEEMEKAGLSPFQMKQFIEQAFLKMPIGQMSMEDEIVPVTVQWSKQTKSKADLLDLKIPTLTGEQKLSNFIELKVVEAPNEINHMDGERLITISADIEGKDLGAVNRKVQKLIEDFNAPAGYTVAVAGDLEKQQELMMDMLFVLAIALFLVYFVMAVQFNHLGHPLIVMSVIPMTIVGVILGLVVTGRELNLMSGMGIVMLIGIVLNNAILLMDRTKQLRNEGLSVEEALVIAGKDRLRPIFMTMLTTVGGMLPLALASGTSGNYQAPMATVIISGLLFATIITLWLIPAVYRLVTIRGLGFSLNRVGQKKAKVKAVPKTIG